MGLNNKNWSAISMTKKEIDELDICKAHYEAKHNKHFNSRGAYILEVCKYVS